MSLLVLRASTPAAAQPSEAAVPPPADEGEPDGRNALLASIRQGKKLKPAKKREIPDAYVQIFDILFLFYFIFAKFSFFSMLIQIHFV